MKLSAVDQARCLLSCRRPDGSDDALPSVQKAERSIAATPDRQEGYQRQRDFDRQIHETLGKAPPTEECLAKIKDAVRHHSTHRPTGRAAVLHPAVIAVVIGVLMVAGVLFWNWRNETKGFEGDHVVRDLIVLASRTPADSMEIAEGALKDQADPLFMKGLERFAAPAEFADWPTMRIKVHAVNQQPVAELLSEDAKKSKRKTPVYFFVLDASDFTLELDPPGSWHFVDHEGWSAVVQKNKGVIFVAALKGNREKLSGYVQITPEQKEK